VADVGCERDEYWNCPLSLGGVRADSHADTEDQKLKAPTLGR
jgi:hypothetical protein